MSNKNYFEVLMIDSDDEEETKPTIKPIQTNNKAGTAHLITCIHNKKVFEKEYNLYKHTKTRGEKINYVFDIIKKEEEIKRAIKAIIKYEEPKFITTDIKTFIEKNNIPIEY